MLGRARRAPRGSARRTTPARSRRRARSCARRRSGALAGRGRRSRCWSCWRRCAPAERIAFVLHDLFAVPFDDIAPIVGRNAGRDAPARQPRPPPRPGRARRRRADRARQRSVVDAFLAARARAATSMRCWRRWIPTSCCAPTRWRSQTAAARAAQGAARRCRPRSMARAPSPRASAGRARGARPALVGGVRARCGRRAALPGRLRVHVRGRPHRRDRDLHGPRAPARPGGVRCAAS